MTSKFDEVLFKSTSKKLQSLNHHNMLKAATYIDDLAEKQSYIEKYIKQGIEIGE